MPRCWRGSQEDKGQRNDGPARAAARPRRGPAGTRGPRVTGQHPPGPWCGGREKIVVDPGSVVDPVHPVSAPK
jgi:hypothetical protein